MRRAWLVLAAISSVSACHRKPAAFSPDARLTFFDSERHEEHSIYARELPLVRVTTLDPYYGREKHYFATALGPLLDRGLPGIDSASELLLRSSDGYTVPIEAGRLLEDNAYLAVADADASTWEPIGPRRDDPGPFYLTWRGSDRSDLETYPRPWSLTRIERVRFEEAYPHVAPTDAALGSPAQQGFAIFRRDCIRCHAINREGGRVGPDLNVPQSISEYRPPAQIRAYIRDPLAFRYSVMPAHPHLLDADLDALVAYFEHMSHHKFDPDRAARELAK